MIFEHPSIESALRLAGALEERMASEERIPVMVAWSSKDDLLVRPEYAWLDVPGVKSLQLPQPLEVIKQIIDYAFQTPSKDLKSDELFKSVGQLRWGLKEFIADVDGNDLKRAILRLKEIERFCRKNWPGWYEAVLGSMEDEIGIGDYSSAIHFAETLSKQAGRVSALEAFRVFFHGAARDIINSGAGQSLAAIRYHRTGGISFQEVIDILSEDRWWPSMAQSLNEVADRISKSGTPDSEIPDIIDRLDAMRKLVCKLSGLFDAVIEGHAVSKDSLEESESDLDALTRVVLELQEMRQDFKKRIGKAEAERA